MIAAIMAIEFCVHCSVSISKGDVTIKKGKTFTSHDYACPSCGKLANPSKELQKPMPDPQQGKDLIIKDGNSELI